MDNRLPTIPSGLEATIVRNATAETLADRLGNPTPANVLATPVLVAWFEAAVSQALLPYLPPDVLILGVHIEIDHLRPTPPGHDVTITATLEKQEGNRTQWRVLAQDESEIIAQGKVRSALVNQQHFRQRLSAKAKPSPTVTGRRPSGPPLS